MRSYVSAVAAGLCVLGGCGTHLPELVDRQVLPLEDLVASIDCEFKNAVRTQIYGHGRHWLKTWQGQYTITLKGNETGGAGLGASTGPIILSRRASLGLGVGAGATTTANRTAILKYNLEFATVKDGPRCLPSLPASGHPMLAGRIGFEEWMDRAFAGALSSKTISDKTSSIASVGHTFEFSLDVNANASPVFTIVPAPITTLSPTGTLDRFEDNIVEVALGRAAGATDSVTKTSAKYDADQLKAINELRAAIKELSDKIDAGDKKLAENQTFIATARELQQYNQSEDAIKRLFPDSNMQTFALRKQNEASRFFTQENNIRLQQLNELDSAVKTQRRERATAKMQLIDTINHPAEQTTVKREVRAPSPLSPDQNPNVTNTQLQLTFERLNNSLRLPSP